MSEVTQVVPDAFSRGDCLITHVRNDVENPFSGGMTIAYSHKKGDITIKIATAVCSPGDEFNRKVGRDVACTNWDNDNTVYIPYPKVLHKEVTVHDYLQYLFGDAVDPRNIYAAAVNHNAVSTFKANVEDLANSGDIEGLVEVIYDLVS